MLFHRRGLLWLGSAVRYKSLDMFYEFLNGGLFIILFYSVLHHLFCINTCYSVNNDFHPKVANSLAF